MHGISVYVSLGKIDKINSYSPKYPAVDHDKVFLQILQEQRKVDCHTMYSEDCQGYSSFQTQSLKLRDTH